MSTITIIGSSHMAAGIVGLAAKASSSLLPYNSKEGCTS